MTIGTRSIGPDHIQLSKSVDRVIDCNFACMPFAMLSKALPETVNALV